MRKYILSTHEADPRNISDGVNSLGAAELSCCCDCGGIGLGMRHLWRHVYTCYIGNIILSSDEANDQWIDIDSSVGVKDS